jgi:dTDP-4-dehydrorhamnose reductase
MVKSVLIVGGSGFIGTHLALRLRESYKVFVTYATHPIAIPGCTCLPMSVENRTWIKQVLAMIKPEMIIYAPGERARSDKRDMMALEAIHAKGVVNVLDCSEMLQPRFVYLSNSYVFDGEKGNFRENELAVPVYPVGKAKASAENFVRAKSLHSVIVRSSPVVGRGNGLNLSFIDSLRMNLDRGKPIEMSSAEVHSFAPVAGLVDMVCEVLNRPALKSKTFHYGGLSKLSYADFARAFAVRYGYDPKLIIGTSALPLTIKKTELLDFSLNSSAAIDQLKIKPFFLEQCLDLLEKELVARA